VVQQDIEIHISPKHQADKFKIQGIICTLFASSASKAHQMQATPRSAHYGCCKGVIFSPMYSPAKHQTKIEVSAAIQNSPNACTRRQASLKEYGSLTSRDKAGYHHQRL